MDESRVMQSMLLDFYGELLTEKQRRCFDLHCNEDLSLSEIAEQCGISRQGVWDNIRRAQAAMDTIEEKTGIVRRFTDTREELDQLRGQLEAICSLSEGEARELAGAACRRLDGLLSRL